MFLFRTAIVGISCLIAIPASPQRVSAESRSVASAQALVDAKPTRTIRNPTAWMPEEGTLNVDLGLDQEKRPTGSASIGLGGIGEFGVSLQQERSLCIPCSDRKLEEVDLNVASGFFKMGLPEGLGHAYVPAVALVFRKALASKAQVLTEADKIVSKPRFQTRSAVLTAMASKTLGPTALHLGAELFAAQGTVEQGDFGVKEMVVRPAAAIQWTPSKYPLSTFLVDVRWISDISEKAGEPHWGTRMSTAWGVRYQAFDWAAVDLNVRRQQGDGLGDALVTLGLRGHFNLRKPSYRGLEERTRLSPTHR